MLKEVKSLLAHRQNTWEPALFEKKGHYLYFDDFMERKRRSKSFVISIMYSQTVLIKRTFGQKYWLERGKALRALDGVALQDTTRRGSNAVVRA